jgi:hypothetical protein
MSETCGTSYEERFQDLKASVNTLKWMVGTNLASQ